MRHSKLSIHWSMRRQRLQLLTSTCLKLVARDIRSLWVQFKDV
jgi:hypothetical protein